ncbi:unnamed protein product [Amaranthus hypochondriacus]
MGLPSMNKYTILFYFLLLFSACFILLGQFNHTVPTITISRNSPSLIKPNKDSLKPSKRNAGSSSKTAEFPLICSSPTNKNQTCPRNNYPTQMEDYDQNKKISSIKSCPDYFRWIYEDLKPWKIKGITKEMVEAGKSLANFRVVIVAGRVYVEKYKKCYQTRDEFTIWGILQMLRLYPGKLPDLDLMFECNDYPVIKKSTNPPLPMFHYCGDDQHFDIPFPDWSFWGWHEINIKPWEEELEDIKEGNKKVKWAERVGNAYWKGNLQMGRRIYLSRCNSTKSWNTQIYQQHWPLEARHGFKQSNVADQCTHRYKIYMEGKAWSVSEKYIQACDSMLLLVKAEYYEFFSRSLLPLKHYWPINPSNLCQSIKFAVNWGNKHPVQAEEIGKAGSKFIMEELKMTYIYDYMFHLLNEYGKLLKYRPSVPSGAVEVCSETMACKVSSKNKEWKLNSFVKSPSKTIPCSIPPPYHPHHLQTYLTTKDELLRDVEGLGRVG